MPCEHQGFDPMIENTLEDQQSFFPLSNEAMQAIDAIEYITDHLRREEEYNAVSELIKPC